ncbi:hypothetical protein BaRGS_00039030, partial [Batillaria attramentaria]
DRTEEEKRSARHDDFSTSEDAEFGDRNSLVGCVGLTARQFQGFNNVIDLQCSGHILGSDIDVLTIVLYVVRNDQVVASANIGKRECSTSGSFSSCVFDAVDSRRTVLRTLVADLREAEWREYGCNVTSFKTGGRVKTTSWSLRVHVDRKEDSGGETVLSCCDPINKQKKQGTEPVARSLAQRRRDAKINRSVCGDRLCAMMFGCFSMTRVSTSINLTSPQSDCSIR